mmetsp:Transcript_2507/g.3691  ORF Transcript_2507/g.3691 Transcript_2507/m.3691 type:complete len:210 (+) Transcript_2507:242-871(+)
MAARVQLLFKLRYFEVLFACGKLQQRRPQWVIRGHNDSNIDFYSASLQNARERSDALGWPNNAAGSAFPLPLPSHWSIKDFHPIANSSRRQAILGEVFCVRRVRRWYLAILQLIKLIFQAVVCRHSLLEPFHYGFGRRLLPRPEILRGTHEVQPRQPLDPQIRFGPKIRRQNSFPFDRTYQVWILFAVVIGEKIQQNVFWSFGHFSGDH